MSKKHRTWAMTQQQKEARKHGEGRATPGAIKAVGGGDLVVSSIDLEAPTNVYDADYAWARIRNGAVSLFFAKASAGDSRELVSRIEVRFAMESFVRYFWRNSRTFYQQQSALAERSAWNLRDREHPEPESLPPKKEYSVWSMLAQLARHGTATSLDFYNMAPDAFARFHRTNDLSKVKVEAMVRVLTTLGETIRMMDESEKIVSQITPLLERAEPLVGPLEPEGTEKAEGGVGV